jgi:hypothetical protein
MSIDKNPKEILAQIDCKIDYKDKIALLTKIRHEIKKKRFILDESIDKFGFDDISLLSKVKNTSEIKGYPLVASKKQSKLLKGKKIALKVVPIEQKYEKHEHPSNLESIALKELTDNLILKNKSPHITFFLGNVKVSNKSRALKFLNLKRLEVEDQIRSNSNMLISEFAEGGSLDNWVYDTYENDQDISDNQWKGLVFQMIYTIAIIQNDYKMMHNDFHYGNILMDTTLKPTGYFVYSIKGKKYYVQNYGVIPLSWDYEFTMTYSDKIQDFYPNKFIIGPYVHDRKTHKTIVPEKIEPSETDDTSSMNVPYNYNEVYDLHYFLISLLDLYISEELFNWIISIYPPELIPKDNESNSSDLSSNLSSNLSSKVSSNLSSKVSDNISDDISDNSNDSSSSESSSESSSKSSSGSRSDSTSEYDEFLSDGRMKCGVEEQFDNLPIPIDIINNSFFDFLRIKPIDFDEKTAIYFDAGF